MLETLESHLAKRKFKNKCSCSQFVRKICCQDFLDGKFLFRIPIDLQAASIEEPTRTPTGEVMQGFRFTVERKVEYPPGLYYFFIARMNEADPLYTGKLELAALRSIC